MYSLRRVLAVRFSLTLFIALGLIALWAMLGVRHTLRDQIDQALSGILTLQGASLASGGHIPRQAPGVDFVPLFQGGSRVVLLRDLAGRVTESSADSLEDFPFDTASFMAAASGRTVKTDESWRGSAIRAVYGPAPAGSPAGTVVIEAAASLKQLADTNRDLLLAMLGTVLLGTLAVGLGAFWLAGSATAPVLEVATQAASIEPDEPGKRITAHTDIAEYESMISVLNGLLDRVERGFQAQRRLTADLGHELRTPLTALRGEMEIALRGERTPKAYQDVLLSGLEEVDRLDRMCDSLLLITTVDSRIAPLKRVPTDVNEMILRSLYTVRNELAERDLHVTTTLDYAGDPLLLDPVLASKMVDELVSNAVKFTPAGGPVILGTEPSEKGVRLWVEDGGPGIAADHVQHLFEPFFRADEARTRGNGTGLGLSTAATIARAHGGAIRAINLPNGGARFEVDLPLGPGNNDGWSVRAA